MKKPLIVLTGPTAARKTHLSIALAEAINGETFLLIHAGLQIYGYWIS